MWLCNLHNAENGNIVNICVQNGVISEVNNGAVSPGSIQLNFENATVLPGLINSHDHLDFNSFPRLGNRIYNNYTEWGRDIHQQNKQVINAVTKIPVALRAEWGIYKNLLAGVTTVVNHGQHLACRNDIITVYQKTRSLHSAEFEKNWKYKLNNPLATNFPVVIHAGEGTDAPAAKEINELVKWNKLKRRLIAVHGVAMNAAQAKNFKAVIWCPATNFFLLDKTAAVDTLSRNTNILFGTDSTLTASWNIWEQLRQAVQTDLLTNEALWQCITTTAADLWKLNCGSFDKGKEASIVIIRSDKKSVEDGSVFTTNPEEILLVMHKGNIRLADESLINQLQPHIRLEAFSRVTINKSKKIVFGNLPQLAQQILNYYPHATFPFTVN